MLCCHGALNSNAEAICSHFLEESGDFIAYQCPGNHPSSTAGGEFGQNFTTKMRGCLGFSVVKFLRKVGRAYWVWQGLQSRHFQLSNGTAMHCWIFNPPNSNSDILGGINRPAVVLIHGFGADGLMVWNPQITALGKHYNLIIPDLIFFGESTTRSSERSEIFQADCIKSLLDVLEVRHVTAVGHSYGGFVAFWMAHKYPHLVNRLVLVSSAVCMTPSTNHSLLKEFGASDIKDVLLPTSVAHFRKTMKLTLYKMPRLPDCIYEDFMKTMGGSREYRAQLLDGMIIGSKDSQPLPIINQEMLIVWGDKDRTFRLEEAYLLQRHMGDKAKMVILKDCGHVPSLEKPSDFNQALLNYLKVYHSDI